MKTPDEIKADAATCLTKPPHAMCDRFDLNKKCKGDCGYVIKELYDLVLHYESRLAQVERENVALLHDLQLADTIDCTCCKHNQPLIDSCDGDCDHCKEPCVCETCRNNDKYEWRGVCEENTKED